MKRKVDWIDKECKNCNIVFKATDRNKLGLCNKCRMQRLNRKEEHELKKPYPLNYAQKKKRYNKIQRDLNNAYTREERREIYARELDFMFETGIWLWCVDRRHMEESKEPGKIGRKPINDIKNKWPDTRYMPE